MKRLLPIMAVLVVLAGCQPYKAGGLDPSAGLPLIANTAQAVEDLYGSSDRWWEGFGDNELNRLVEDALAKNLEIKGAAERVLQSREIARQYGASRLPTISAGFSGTRARQQGATGPATGNTYNLSATASYEIDIWGKLGARARAAVYESEAAVEQLKARYMSISAEASEQYFMVIQQNEHIALSDLTISSLERILQSVELRYGAGLVSSLDVYQARQNLAMSSTERPGYEINRHGALAALAVIMGNTPERSPEINGKNLPEPPPFPHVIPSDLLERRPDVQAALLALKASDEKVAAAVADRFPSFNLSLTYGGAGSDLDSILDSPNIFWNLLMQTALPVFDAGRRKSEVRRSESVLRERLASYHGTVLNSLREAHVALLRNRTSEEQVRLFYLSVEAGEDTLRVAQDQYLQGITDYMNLLSAQQQLYTARNSLVRAKRGLLSARIELARALGGTWMDEQLNTLSTEEEARNEDGQ
ncbi:MAG: efflux transporter outer membrane subunit [Thermodesulfovibrionales bacterium]|nr:efflux transporter outer membrane subunit [Thermodesulfovibrionales bacterium]